jgi:hypothetical protein
MDNSTQNVVRRLLNTFANGPTVFNPGDKVVVSVEGHAAARRHDADNGTDEAEALWGVLTVCTGGPAAVLVTNDHGDSVWIATSYLAAAG